MADKRTNRLLIRDDARHLPALKAWAQEMDLPGRTGGAGRSYRVDERNQPSRAGGEVAAGGGRRLAGIRTNHHPEQRYVGERCQHPCGV